MLRPSHRGLLLAALAVPALALAQKGSRFFPYEPKVSRLANGLTVVRLQFPSEGLVAYQTVVRVGSRNEVEPGHTGFAHFFEHMMFKGTPRFPEGEREELLARAGFNDNAYTTDDFTVYHSYGPSSSLEALVDVEADRFRNLTYVEPSFQTEAKAVLGEYHKSAARPELKLEETLLRAAFSKHPYEHTTLGFYEDIQKMPGYYQYSKQFFERWYTPDNCVLVVVGHFDDARLMKLVEQHYGPWKGKAARITIPFEPPQPDFKVATVEWKGPALPRQILAWRTPAASLDTLHAAIQEVLTAYLVGPTSDLHKQLVLEQQIAESVGSWFYPHRDPYLFTLDAKMKDEKHRAAVLDAFNKTIKDLVSGRVDRKRIEDIKSNIRYGFLMGLESADQVAGQIAFFIGIYGAADALERHFQNVRKVTPEQLVGFARDHFTARKRIEVKLTAEPESEKSAESAAGGAK